MDKSRIMPQDHFPPNSHAVPEIPRFVLQTSPASAYPLTEPNGRGTSNALALPLNLLVRIVAYLDDIGDIARVTRTCKLLYYMTLPQLYRKVSLHSYGEVRYVNRRPEGYGGGSPFMMALNGLLAKSHAQLVEELRVWGVWHEVNEKEFDIGRVPDNSMMLNMILRAAIDKMCKLDSFSWELNTKPLKTLYQGLAASSTVTRLTLRCPNRRTPRPSVVIPPMPSLKAFKFTDIDPLCYPDDVSLLILGSKQLEDLRLHFSPRMRREAEPSLSPETYFGRCMAANYKLPLKHFAWQNFFGSPGSMDVLFADGACSSVTAFDCFGGALGAVANKFIDDGWNMLDNVRSDFRVMRCNEQAVQHVRIIQQTQRLERLYFVGCNRGPSGGTPPTNGTHEGSLVSPAPSVDREGFATLGKEYLHALTRYHGSTLTHLLLSDQWSLSTEDLADLIRYCPNLEQLGLALDLVSHDSLRLLLPFLKQLTAVRILANDWLMEEMRTKCAEEMREEMMVHLHKLELVKLKWICVGDRIYMRTGNEVQVTLDGKMRTGAEMLEMDSEAVAEVDIWKMDSLDLDIDPIGGIYR